MRLIAMPISALVWWAAWILAPLVGVDVGAAQTPIGEFPWSSLVANGGALSILGWYLYYTTAYVNPRREEKYQEHVQKVVDSVSGLAESFRQDSREQRQWHQQQVESLQKREP